MLTYQTRPRLFRLKPGVTLQFPAKCEVRFVLMPKQPFGMESGGGGTAVKGVGSRIWMNGNNGRCTIESEVPLAPLELVVDEGSRVVRLTGNELIVADQLESLSDLEHLIRAGFFILPTLLNVPFADPPYVERVDGKVGDSEFGWELEAWLAQFRTTTQAHQTERFRMSWERMPIVVDSTNRRLAAALHYFHTACRLARVGYVAGEFVAEVLLNLTKCLEVLFPPAGDGRTRDAVRSGLRTLGYSDEEIEGDFIPAMALRNSIDVGHVELGLLKLEHLKAIHSFTERAEECFREMLERLLTKLAAGEFKVVEHELGPAGSDMTKLLERLIESETRRTARPK